MDVLQQLLFFVSLVLFQTQESSCTIKVATITLNKNWLNEVSYVLSFVCKYFKIKDGVSKVFTLIKTTEISVTRRFVKKAPKMKPKITRIFIQRNY
jgi:hypothetical protein